MQYVKSYLGRQIVLVSLSGLSRGLASMLIKNLLITSLHTRVRQWDFILYFLTHIF